MKKILLFIVTLLVVLTACNKGKRHVAPDAEWADEGPMLMCWQTNISDHRLWAENLGFIEDDSVEIRTLVEKLRIQAKANDTLVVSCLMLEDAAQDTVVQLYGIK
jgi:hypothetical protein